MNQISVSEFRKLSLLAMRAIKPVIVTFDGDPVGIFCDPAKIIVIEDLHPRVQIQLRALEKKARSGMPRTEKVVAAEVIPKD